MQPRAIAQDFMPRDHNVNGVFRGFKYRNGRRTDAECIVFTMRRKRAVADLHPDERIPIEIDGEPTDVLEVPMFEAPRPIPPRPRAALMSDAPIGPQAFTERIRPAEPGYGVSHPDVTVGTFGLAVKWGPTDDWRILSNNHVLANSNDASIGDFIRQPGTHDGGTTTDRIGRLLAFATLNFEGAIPGKPKAALGRLAFKTMRFLWDTGARAVGCSNRLFVHAMSVDQPTPNLVDVALGEPTDQALISTLVDGIGQPREIRRVTLGTLTAKKGRTTEITRLVCDGVDGTFRVQYGGGRIGAFQQTDIYVAEDGGEGSAGGDSGSAILSRDGSIWYSLLFAGGGGRTLWNQALNCASVLGNGLRLS